MIWTIGLSNLYLTMPACTHDKLFRNTTLKKGTKSSGENKSQAIRDYALANPDLGPTQISRDLQAQGINAYPALVSQALRSIKGEGAETSKGKVKKGRPAKKTTAPKTRTGRTPVATSGVDYVSVLKNTSEFIKQCGGVEQALEAVKVFQKVSSILQD